MCGCIEGIFVYFRSAKVVGRCAAVLKASLYTLGVLKWWVGVAAVLKTSLYTLGVLKWWVGVAAVLKASLYTLGVLKWWVGVRLY